MCLVDMFHIDEDKPLCTLCTGSKVNIVILQRRMGLEIGSMFIALEGFVREKSLSNVRIFLAWSQASNHAIPWLTYISEARLPSTVHELN